MSKKRLLSICLTIIFILVNSTILLASPSSTEVEKEKKLKAKIEQKAKLLREKLKRAPSEITIMSTSVPIGTNMTFTTANYTDWSEYESGAGGYAETGFSQYEGWADAGASSTAVSEAEAMSYIGNSVSVTGSGARRAKVTFSGNYNLSQVVVAPSGTAASNCQVYVEVIDLTTGTTQIEKVIYENTITQSSSSKNGAISTYIIPTLTAGHTYAFRMGAGAITIAEVAASCVEAALCDGSYAGWTPSDGGKGIDYSSIKLEWYAY